MDLTVARFDLDPTPRVRNTARRKRDNHPLPTDFPFLLDLETSEIVRPVLVHLANKFNQPANFEGREWTGRNPADAAVNDLRDWFIYLDQKGRRWDDADDRLLTRYLKALQVDVSEKTEDFLAYSTISRRCSSIDEFHKFAVGRWPEGRFPAMDAAKRAAGIGKNRSRHRTDVDPHPLSPALVDRLAARLGPLPSEQAEGSSRVRLAFEIGVNVGMRIDEIVSLRADMIANLQANGLTEDDMVDLELFETKGLVPRVVHMPVWLLRELNAYAEAERQASIEAGGRTWIRSAADEPVQLLLNSADGRSHAGKQLRAKTIEEKVNEELLKLGSDPTLGSTRKVLKARGTEMEKWAVVPAHTFHDARHTYAHWTYLGLTSQGVDPWLYIRNRLGHRNLRTTVDTYMTAFNDLGSEVLAELTRSFARNRRELTK